MKKFLLGLLAFTTLVFAQDASRVLTGAAQPPLPFNILPQPGFEAGTTGWSVTGGSFTATTNASDVARGRYSAKWIPTASASSGLVLQSNLIPIPPGLYGRKCRAQILFKGTSDVSNATFTFDAYDGTTSYGSVSLTTSSTYKDFQTSSFDCPSSGSLRLRIVAGAVSASPSAIYVDEAFLGESNAIGIGSVINGIGTFGSSPNSGGATISGTSLVLQPADATNPGGVTTGTQTFAGAKTFSSAITADLVGNVTGNLTGNASTATALAVAPTPCGSGYVYAIAADGTLSCNQVVLTTDVTGTLPIANGGTGQTTANAALNALLPSQGGNSGKLLTTNGTNTSWTSAASFGGDVSGPASSTDSAIALFDGTTGKLLKNQSKVAVNTTTGLMLSSLSNATDAIGVSGYTLSQAFSSGSGGGDYIGIKSATTNSASNIGDIRLFSAEPSFGTAGSGGAVVGYYWLPSQTGTATSRDYYGVWLDSANISATNYYGLYISGASSGTITGKNYSLYIAGGKSFFGGNLELLESSGAADKITLTVPALAASYTLTLPVDDGTANQVLTTDGSGVLSWTSPGSGTVTSVGLSMPGVFSVSGSPVTTSGTLAVTASGTSGGIPYFSGATTMASSAALAANQLVIGGGAGAAPATLGSLGTTTTVLHGNAAGAPTFGAVSLTADVSGVLPIANGGTNSNATPTAGGIGYGTGTAHAYTSAGTSGNWVLSGGSGAPTMSNTTTTGKFVDGSADEIQLQVQGHSTQTNQILRVDKSDSTLLLAVTNTGGTQIRGTTTNDSAVAGFLGEYVESIISTNTSYPTSGTWGDMTSISLTAGDWDVSLTAYFNQNGATVSGQDIGISSTSGNSSSGLTLGTNQLPSFGPTATYDNSSTIANYRVSISATTTYYAKLNGTYSVATPRYRCRLSARRIR